MDFRIQDVPKSAVSEFSFGAMACCIISYQVSEVVNKGITNGALTIISIAGIIFIGWLIWFFKMYLGGRMIKVMPRKPGRVVEAANWIVFAIWIVTDWWSKICHPALAIGSWCLWVGCYIYYLIYMSRQK